MIIDETNDSSNDNTFTSFELTQKFLQNYLIPLSEIILEGIDNWTVENR